MAVAGEELTVTGEGIASPVNILKYALFDDPKHWTHVRGYRPIPEKEGAGCHYALPSHHTTGAEP